MIIKTICPSLYIHPFLYFLVFVLLLTGRVKQLFLFMGLIFIHELGHFLTAKVLGWKTDKIELYPYGGISKFTTFVNVPLREEFLVLIMGPVGQVLGYCFLHFLLPDKWLPTLFVYHMFLLKFNLLPIYPLDGGRLLHLFLSRFFSFYKSFYITEWISILVLFCLIMYVVFYHSLFFLLVLFLLILKLKKEWDLFPYIFHKFLLERCLYTWNFRRKCVIFEKRQMKRDTYHLFKRNGRYMLEEDYLKKF